MIDYDDVAYDQHADLLYDLAGQTVAHLLGYLPEDEARKVLHILWRHCQTDPQQMQQHYWEDAGYEVKVSRGFMELKPSAYTSAHNEAPLDFRHSPADKSNMARYLFGGFTRCLYAVQKFQAEGERILAVVLERDAIEWFKPAKGQFQIFYKSGIEHLEYQPDFVAETDTAITMLEPKDA